MNLDTYFTISRYINLILQHHNVNYFHSFTDIPNFTFKYPLLHVPQRDVTSFIVTLPALQTPVKGIVLVTRSLKHVKGRREQKSVRRSV